VTVLSVTLRSDGQLEATTVTRSSGLAFLDNEAVDAFRKAQPFAAPPTGLLEDGRVRFNFGFIFEPSGHSSVKVFV
jgi:TonB family protein